MLGIINRIGGVLVLRVLSALLAFYVATSVTSVLSISDSGIFFFTTTSLLVMVSVSTLGLQNVALKKFSEGIPEEGILLSFFVTSFIASVLLIVVCYFYVEIEGLSNSWIYLVLMLISASLMQISSLTFQGLGHYYKSLLFQTFILNMLFIMQIYFLHLDSLFQLVLAYTISSVGACLLSIIILGFVVNLGSKINVIDDFKLGKEFLLINVLSQILMLGGAIISKNNLTNDEFAVVSVCMRISVLLNFLIVATNFIYSPKIVRLAKENIEQALQMLKNISVFSTLATLPVVCFITLYSDSILSVFGSEYTIYGDVLLILVVSQISVSMLGAGGQFLALTGHEVLLRKIMMVTVSISLLVSYIGSLYYGLIGAVVGVAISTVFQNFSIIIALGVKFGVVIVLPKGILK